MSEEWKTVVDDYGAPIEYAVSTLGRVKSLKSRTRMNRIMKGGEGPRSPEAKRRAVWLMDSYSSNSAKYWVDMLVARAFLGEGKTGAKLEHINGCDWDDRAENLRWREEGELPTSVLEPLPTPEQSD